MDWFSFLHGFATLATAIQYWLSGMSFGVIPPVSYENAEQLSCLIMKGSTLLSMLYFTAILVVDMYYGYYDGFILPISLLALLTLTFLFSSLAKNDEKALESDLYRLLFVVFQAILLIKLSHTSYFMIDNRINYKLPTSGIKDRVLTASLILELFQLLFWTLTPFLWFPSSKRHLTLWSYEYADLISHIVVIILYLKQSHMVFWDNTIKAYFVFYIINLFIWVIPLMLVCLGSEEKIMIPAMHCSTF
ncbi:unnamed protein product [Adineta ricciae]|uniref:Uncharacterized protein n=1 Tax=Adineta ricciae TaxID=249248 RepID=A0A814WK26_ADIRI|nr:unnamed protein product [Adineta ricciae]CAF1537808.1 unnamed protein product [Adineta ricciae]